MLGILIVSLYCFCIRRKRLMAAPVSLQMPTTDVEAHTQQEIACNVDSNTSTSSQTPTMESSPPSYEQSQIKKF